MSDTASDSMPDSAWALLERVVEQDPASYTCDPADGPDDIELLLGDGLITDRNLPDGSRELTATSTGIELIADLQANRSAPRSATVQGAVAGAQAIGQAGDVVVTPLPAELRVEPHAPMVTVSGGGIRMSGEVSFKLTKWFEKLGDEPPAVLTDDAPRQALLAEISDVRERFLDWEVAEGRYEDLVVKTFVLPALDLAATAVELAATGERLWRWARERFIAAVEKLHAARSLLTSPFTILLTTYSVLATDPSQAVENIDRAIGIIQRACGL